MTSVTRASRPVETGAPSTIVCPPSSLPAAREPSTRRSRIDPRIQAIFLGIIVVLAVALDELSQRRAALAAIFLDRIRARGL
jgi:hypothetical protein